MARAAAGQSPQLRSFRTAGEFNAWLRANHATADEVWVRLYKKGSGEPSVTLSEALDAVLCWGWIDGIRKSYDASSYLQRYTPRRKKSLWSQINRDHVARLVAAERMMPSGLAQVEAAKADGRWDAAYAPMRKASADTVPADLRAAIDANPRARRAFATLNRANLFALTFRLGQIKTPAGRVKKIDALVEMLARGETIVPQPRN